MAEYAQDFGGSTVPIFQTYLLEDTLDTHIFRYPPNAQSSCFGRLSPFFDIWRQHCEGDRLPVWEAFSFQDFSGWHSHMALSDISTKDPDPKFRFFGSDMALSHAGDYTGQRFTSFGMKGYQAGLEEHFREICLNGHVGYAYGKMIIPGKEHRKYEVLELPLINHAGDVCQLLHCFLTDIDSAPR